MAGINIKFPPLLPGFVKSMANLDIFTSGNNGPVPLMPVRFMMGILLV